MNEIFNYSNAINPKVFTVCGVELKSFCMGHYLLLEQVNSPFLTDDPNSEIDWVSGISQFYLTLLICAQSYEDGLTMLNNEKLMEKSCKQFVKNLKKTMKKERDWNIYSKIGSFKEYITYFTEMPVFQVERKNNGMGSGIDWKQTLFTIAKNEWGYSDSEILNMPLRRLFSEWCSYAEKNGGIRVQTAEELRMLEEYRQRKNSQLEAV